MPKLDLLKSVNSLHGLAQLLDYKPASLTFLLYKMSAQQKYRTFTIPKRSGGERTISAPVDRLKTLQRKVADLLNECLQEIEVDFQSPAHGFKPNKSIFTNADCHKNRRYVFNVDLENFFPSIHFGRVKGMLEKSEHFSLHPIVARALANIVCHNAVLPQGAPSSPVVSNLIARMLDVHLARLAKRNRVTYTRYADDLTFSTNLPIFPIDIGLKVDEHKWLPSQKLVSLISACGFKVNDKKTRLQYKSSRQEVTGLVVNDCVSVPVDYRRWARASVSRLIKVGSFYEPIPQSFVGPSLEIPTEGSINRLEGALSFIYSAHAYSRKKKIDGGFSKDALNELHSDEFVYRKFLFYIKFFATDKPTIVCEGETDGIYLRYALEALANSYPDLVDNDKKKGEKNRLLLRIAKHNEVAGRILNLNGGTDALKQFSRIYVEQSKKFLATTPSNPLIIIVDNDKAGKDVINYGRGIANNQKIDLSSLGDFTFFWPNVYIISVASKGSADVSVIEDLFSKKLLDENLGGKSLTLKNSKAEENEFGKTYFAKYVLPKAESDDFNGFEPLLKNISNVILDFKSRINSYPFGK